MLPDFTASLLTDDIAADARSGLNVSRQPIATTLRTFFRTPKISVLRFESQSFVARTFTF